MKPGLSTKKIITMGLLTVLVITLTTGLAAGTKLPTEILTKLLNAVETNDYDSFVAPGNAMFKAGLTRQMLQGVSIQMAPRMKRGYDMKFLGHLKQQGCIVYLWKLVYLDNGDPRSRHPVGVNR